MSQHSGIVSQAIKASPLADVTAFERRRESVRAILTQAKHLAIFGAGQNGRMVASILRRHGLEASAFMDDTHSKLGTIIGGLRVEPVPQPGRTREPLSSVPYFRPNTDSCPFGRDFRVPSIQILSLFDLLWCFDEDALPFYFLDRPSLILDNLEQIDWLADQFADEASQQELMSHVKFRLGLDHSLLPRPGARRIGPPPDWNSTIYVDGGAYDGDTLLRFVDNFCPSVSEGIGIEPDNANYELLRNSVAASPDRIKNKVSIVNAGLGTGAGQKRFSGGKLQDSAFSQDGNMTVQTISVDDLLKDRKTSEVYVKFDIEGAEHDAILGSRKLISSSAPILAISLYHKPGDLWELPKLVHGFAPEYRFFLRSHGEDGADLTAYACHKSLGENLPVGLHSK